LKQVLEKLLEDKDLNIIKQSLTTKKEKLKLVEPIELDDLKNNIPEK